MSSQINITVQNPPRYKVVVKPATRLNVSVAGRILISQNGGAFDLVSNEVPAGDVDGSNATFTSNFSFIPESVEVYVNGLKQKPITHYQTSGNQTIVLNESPLMGDQLLINYLKQ